MSAVRGKDGGVFFLYGYGGTGKTFIWRALASGLRSKGEIVITVASSGIAALLIPGGRTAHSRFCIPLNINEDSTCHIKAGSPLAELLESAKLIIWDEALMVNKNCFEALDRTLRDVLRFSNPRSMDQPFGGKVIVFGGDFRQTLPVLPRGTRAEIVNASITSSYLWQYCKVLTLTKNMRLLQTPSNGQVHELEEFANWLLKVGDGDLGEPNDGEETIDIPPDFLVTPTSGNPISAIVEAIYTEFEMNRSSPSYFQERAILAPTHDVVEDVNDYMLSLIEGEHKTYFSADSICKTEGGIDMASNLYPTDYLNSIKCSGLPNHALTLKVGAPVMLLRNIDQSVGLCNGTRLIITQLGSRVVEGMIISGSNIGMKVPVPRMLLSPSDSSLPFKLQRRQFPLLVCFAMTINKSQGQSLSRVGIYLPRPIFTHGQFYVAASRVTNKEGLKILVLDTEQKVSSKTTNVVYKEVLQRI